MSPPASADRPPGLRTGPLRLAACLIAASGTLAAQFAWLDLYDREPAASWWPVDAVALVAATAYLLATALLHWRAFRTLPAGEIDRPFLLRSLLADAAVALYVLIVGFRGPQADLYRAGLWILLPTLLTVAICSAGATLVAIRSSSLRDRSLPVGYRTRSYQDTAHSVLAALLLLAFFGVEYLEPESPTRAANSNSGKAAVHSQRDDAPPPSDERAFPPGREAMDDAGGGP